MVRSTNAKIKTAKTVLASSVFLGMAFGTARAEICWRITPFADVIRATEITDNGNAPAGSNFGSTHNLLFGNWINGTTYELPFVGAIEFDNTSTPAVPKLRFNIHASNHTAGVAGSHSDCTLDTLLGSSGTGAVKASCVGNLAGITNFTATALTLISCENLPAAAQAEGKGLLQ